jgi:NAD(P)-dependent dehydrogenase (short-subunit alcohol dehydrogenase family)
MSKTIAVFGTGPGMGRSIARRFGQEGFEVARQLRPSLRSMTPGEEKEMS